MLGSTLTTNVGVSHGVSYQQKHDGIFFLVVVGLPNGVTYVISPHESPHIPYLNSTNDSCQTAVPDRVHCLLSQPSHLEAYVSSCPMSHLPPSNVWRNHRNPSKQRVTPVTRNIVEVGGGSPGCQGGLTAPQQETLAL